ncbi:agmatinase [Imperialibacter roseus]|uniref:Agmatinase n=1 Tax=Imperialibacter roseus TaxID=1324217 RepID=A0ABZ0IJ71_9BACT|nr:agmatinase [Imperialibacter roseus]WOK04586.1 agmatinase [Imperialibacter roseus]|tara:strand:+ start:30298 stop:31083 length:786 start_codon:yes stop_codon:yes gene_type:complete
MKPINLLGIPFDANSSFKRGPAQAPPLIRKALHSDSTNYFNEAGQNVKDLLIDAGDISPMVPYDALQKEISKIYTPSEKWIFLGGDHSVTYPILQAVAPHYPKLSILHLDAHSDLYDELDGNRFSHACPFARIMENGLAQSLTQVGIRTLNKHQKEQAEKFHVNIIPMNKWTEDMTIDIDGPVYISLDIDVLDPAFAPGISHYEPGGASTRQVINFIQRHQHLNIVAADIVEYNPIRDRNDMTAFVAAKFLKELAGIMSAS